MNKETVCFRDSIRRTFISYSMVPVVVVALLILAIVGFSWTYSATYMNERENRETSEELSRVMGVWYGMINEVRSAFLKNGCAVKDQTSRILYDSCGDFGDTGNLVVLSADQEVLYTSKGTAPYYLTEPQYSDWGILMAARRASGAAVTVLGEGELCIGRGVYEGNDLKCFIVYVVPESVIVRIAGKSERIIAIADEKGWIYTSNNKNLSDTYGKLSGEFDKDTGFFKAGRKIYYLCRTLTKEGLAVITIDDMSTSIRVIMLLVAVIITVFAGVVFITYKSTDASSEKYTADIRKIESAFESVSNGNLDVRLHTDSSKEFKTIGNDFNEMLKSLREQIEANKELATDAR